MKTSSSTPHKLSPLEKTLENFGEPALTPGQLYAIGAQFGLQEAVCEPHCEVWSPKFCLIRSNTSSILAQAELRVGYYGRLLMVNPSASARLTNDVGTIIEYKGEKPVWDTLWSGY